MTFTLSEDQRHLPTLLSASGAVLVQHDNGTFARQRQRVQGGWVQSRSFTFTASVDPGAAHRAKGVDACRTLLIFSC
jgi:hypothetical protein